MKKLLLGGVIIVVVLIGGLVYRNAVEHPSQPITCPVDKLACPDGTFVAREGMSCEFPVCAPPNISLSSLGIAFALPPGFVENTAPDATGEASYELPGVGTTTQPADIAIYSYAISASSTALATIQATAISGTSERPVNPTLFTSKTINGRTFTVVPIERFEGVIDTAYYLTHGAVLLRFEAIDRGADWTNPTLTISTLPAHGALEKMLGTLQAQ